MVRLRPGAEILAKPDFVIAYDFPGYTDVFFREAKEEFGVDKVIGARKGVLEAFVSEDLSIQVPATIKVEIEDQFSPKRCPAAAATMPLIPVAEAVAKIRAAVDARCDPDFLIVARTDAVDPSAAMDRAARYAEAGADLIQPISRTFKGYADLVKLREVCGRRLSLQLMQGVWMAGLSREQIESVAAFASYPIATLMTVVTAMQQNLATLAARRNGSFDGMPCPRTTMAEFKKVIGFEAIEALQAHYELAGR